MRKINVYRMEHRVTGNGPFNNNELMIVHGIYIPSMMGYTSISHPSPFNDGLNEDATDYFFACPNMGTFKHWFSFSPDINNILKDFQLKIYRTNHYIRGNSGKQVVFLKKKAILVKIIELIDI